HVEVTLLRWPWLLLVPFAGFLTAGCRNPSITVRADSPVRATSAARQTHEPLRLIDVTGPSGVRFHHTTGAFGRKWFPETNGAGAALFDYDGDGYPDLFLVNGRDWSPAERNAARPSPDEAAAGNHPTSRLYRNRGDGTFEDVTHAAGLDVPMYGMGCAVGDYNNDGFPDL